MGKPRITRKYPKYPEIPESKKDTRKYPIVFFDTPTRPATRYFVQYPTRPDPILKNPTRWVLMASGIGDHHCTVLQIGIAWQLALAITTTPHYFQE